MLPFDKEGLDPIIAGAITGWASPGSTVVLKVGGQVVSTATAELPRQFVFRRTANEDCGFSLDLPSDVREGGTHTLTICDEAGRDLPGSPLVYEPVRAEGKVESVDGNLIRGRILATDAQAGPFAVAAVVGDETVAIAAATRDATGEALRFTLILPSDIAANGHRFVHVAIVGAAKTLSGSPAILAPVTKTAIATVRRQPPVTLAIKIAAPNLKVAHEWGDYHFARQLGAALQRRGWVVRVDCQDQWDKTGDDATLVLRGRHQYKTSPDAINMMWQISHPDRLAQKETLTFDHIFVASDIHTKAMARLTPTPITTLHQATDPNVFRPPVEKIPLANRCLFVGNSRREFRSLVKWCIEENIDVAVYGNHWDDVVPSAIVRGKHITNEELHKWYGSCEVLLNDHWDTMRDLGFLSNRLFDGSAAGAFIISDEVKGLAAVFGDAIETAADAKELRAKIAYYDAHPELRAERAARAREIVLNNHTFDHRAETIAATYQQIRQRRVAAA